MLLLGGLLFLLIRFGLGMKMGYTAGWDGRLPGYGAALMMGIGETCGYLIRSGSLLIVLFPLYLFRMIGAGDIKMAAVLFGAAGLRQGIYYVAAQLQQASFKHGKQPYGAGSDNADIGGNRIHRRKVRTDKRQLRPRI